MKTGVSLLKLGAAKVDGNQCSGRKLSFEEEPKEEVKKVTFAPGTKGGDMTPFTMNSCDRKSDPPLSAESVDELNKAISEAQKQNKAERKEDRKTGKTAAKAKCEGNKTKKQKEHGKEDEGKKASAGKDKGKNQKAGKSKKDEAQDDENALDPEESDSSDVLPSPATSDQEAGSIVFSRWGFDEPTDQHPDYPFSLLQRHYHLITGAVKICIQYS